MPGKKQPSADAASRFLGIAEGVSSGLNFGLNLAKQWCRQPHDLHMGGTQGQEMAG